MKYLVPTLVILLEVVRLSAADSAATQPGTPYEHALRAFAQADLAKPPIPGGILFVGSSILQQWTNAAEIMAPLAVLNRAVSGSRTADQLAFFDSLVMPYTPRVIVYYCGSNDLKAGDNPDAIFERFRAFSDRVSERLPAARILFLSSTRSPDRVARWQEVDHYNALARAFCTATPRRTFVDLNPALVDSEGRPRLDLYQPDKLHLQPSGYAALAVLLKPTLTRVWTEAITPASPAPMAPGAP